MNVLVTSAGSTNGVNIIKALDKKVRITAVDCDELAAGLYMSDAWFVVPKSTDDKYIEVLTEIVLKDKIDVIFPAHSNEIKKLINSNLSNLLVISPIKAYEITENKIMCKAFLNNIDIPTPKQYYDKFPMIVKPIVGTGSKNTVKVNDKKELDFYLKKDMFYEEFIEGVEYTVIGISDFDKKMVCALPTIRLKTRGGMAVRSMSEDNPELVSIVKKVAENMKLAGVWNMQCIRKNNKYYFIDINNRFPAGSMPLATASGMNIPLILINILSGNKVTPNLVYDKTMLRYYESIIL